MLKLVGIKSNSKYLIEYLEEVIKPLLSILSRIIGYIMTLQDKGADKNKNNKYFWYFLRIDDNMLLGQHKIISTKVVDLKDIELHDLPGYGSRYIKTKIRT